MNEVTWYGFRPEIWHELFSILTLMVMLIPAAIGDYQRQKIPNLLSMSGWVIGPVLALFFSGVGGLGDALLGLSFMLGIMFPLWMIHWFGAADVKLLGSVGAIAGFDLAPTILFGVMITGLVVSLFVLIHRRRLVPLVLELFSGQLITSLRADNNQQCEHQPIIPYAIPIAFGTMLSLLYVQL